MQSAGLTFRFLLNDILFDLLIDIIALVNDIEIA